MALNMSVLTLCKFTPLGFETTVANCNGGGDFSVNLPRWGLKHHDGGKVIYYDEDV